MKIISFRSEDGLEVSNLIRKTLEKINSKYYPQNVINFLSKEYSPENLRKMTKKKELLLAIKEEVIIGVAGLEENHIGTVFVSPKYQNQGIGKKLMFFIEKLARKRGFSEVKLNSSINALDFYKRIGYEQGEKVEEENYGITYMMTKRL
ncbi:MAG: GNAT family N-acetyltransferase [Candidatus Lokiarchaeota archaeon]|nr:GNAT family N-acetyltransferase [Candidatus Lokiarchaeota archaeon]